jgi:glyoxylase-like metal-dependent hydrolase (beta-lactamase superfamily II)
MTNKRSVKLLTRRQLLQSTTVVAGGTVVAGVFHGSLVERLLARSAQQPAAAPPSDPLAAIRAQMAAAPIETVKLGGNLTMLSGPGGNVVVLHGADGKIVVDTFVLPVWSALRKTIDGMGDVPIKLLINTHWHFDHTDNNANFRQAGAGILAHENTAKRLSESHDLLGMHFEPAPATARPTETFKDTHKMQANGEAVELGYIQPAHTDTDIYIHYTRSNVMHLGDCFFNGVYPVIDAGTGGNVNGMIAAADRALKMGDNSTRFVPGHGPLADRAALTSYRDMLVTVRDRVRKLKTSGRKLEEVQASKPSADFDATWGKGFMMPNDFLAMVYNTL